MSTQYTAVVAKPSSLSEDLAASVRVSLVRARDGSAGSWVAEVEGLPGSSVRASTPEEAVRQALHGSGTPVEATPNETGSPSSRTGNDARRSGRLLVRMPATLHDELARVAEREGVSLNQLITGVLAASVEWRSDARPRGVAEVSGEDTGRLSRIAILVNVAVVGLVAAIAIVLLVVAVRDGI